MADYWMKLYIEILDDPKMATLPDRIWRRVIELFLVAKRQGKDGHLPDTRQIAWILRLNPDDLAMDLAQIAQTGIIVQELGGWFIPKFAQRQAAVPDAERKAQERKRAQSRQYSGDVTNQSRSVTQSTEDRLTESESETESETEVVVQQRPDIFAVYESEVGPITPFLAEDLKLVETEYPDGWFVKAVKVAKKSTTRVTLNYIKAIMKRWKSDGLPAEMEEPKARPSGQKSIVLPDGSIVEARL